MLLRTGILVVACCALWASAAVNPHHKPRRPHHKSENPKMMPQPDCNPDECGYKGGNPECACASADNPGLYPEDSPSDFPQFVVLSFDDAVTVQNYEFYINLHKNYKNPNDCPITMTYFITHMYNDYAKMNDLHRLGNEIAAHSVSHVADVSGYWKPANYSTWYSEIFDVKEMIKRYGLIPEDDIKGWRAPFLEVGGDDMYQALVDAGFHYDSSISTFTYTNWYTNAGETAPRGALYPFTMDNALQNLDCSVGTCPEEIYPGFWVTPMINLDDPRDIGQPEMPNVKAPCNMLGSCIDVSSNDTDDSIWDCETDICKNNLRDWLKDSFHNHYDNNRAPFGLYAHYAWFLIDEMIDSRHKEAYLEFLDYLVELPDVYIVSLSTVIEYMKDPYFAGDMEFWPPVTCKPPPTTNCPDPITCTYEGDLPFAANRVTMDICTRPCPEHYPWLGDIEGLVGRK